MGGTSIIYVAGVPFEKIGFNTKLPNTAALKNINLSTAASMPYGLVGLGIATAGLNWIIERRNKNKKPMVPEEESGD